MKTWSAIISAVALGAVMLAPGVRAADISQRAGVFGAYQDTDLLSEGWGVGVKYAVTAENVVPDVPRLSLGLDLRASWLTDFEENSDLYPLEGIALLGYEIGDGMVPYIGAGMGYYFWDSDVAAADDTFAGNVVVGWDQKVYENVSVFAEGKYLYGNSELEGFGGNAGVSYHF